MTFRSIRRAYWVYARYTVTAPMRTATSVFMLLPPPRLPASRQALPRRARLGNPSGNDPPKRLDASAAPGAQVRGDQRLHPGEIRAHVTLTVHAEGGIFPKASNQR